MIHILHVMKPWIRENEVYCTALLYVWLEIKINELQHPCSDIASLTTGLTRHVEPGCTWLMNEFHVERSFILWMETVLVSQ